MAQAVLTKRIAINKANAQMVGSVGVAAFVTVFCLVAVHALWGQNAYLSRVNSAKDKANKQLQANVTAASNLASSYKTFVGSNTNAIGGSATGTDQNDGDNAKIVLDALPSSYDFPALTASIEQILTSNNLKVATITGTDDEVAQAATTGSGDPQPVPMPFSFDVTDASYSQIQNLIQQLQSSIRPIQIDTITLSGSANNMKLTLNAHTYYQPGKTLNITKESVK
jgi:Tfp pilus assembly protein PilO